MTLCIDFYFVNGITVFHKISCQLGYCTVDFPLSCSKTVILDHLKNVYQLYNTRGFRIRNIHSYFKFEKLCEDLRPAHLQVCGVNEHIPEIEQLVQTQKMRTDLCVMACHIDAFPK